MNFYVIHQMLLPTSQELAIDGQIDCLGGKGNKPFQEHYWAEDVLGPKGLFLSCFISVSQREMLIQTC